MFKEINTLKDFGPYKAYSWSQDEDMRAFAKFNLFYGWNYSGKTTFSRLFECLRTGQLVDPFQIATFRAIKQDGTAIDERNLQPDPSIRVFNVDYIQRNLRWDRPDEGVEPVLILGEENVALQKRLNEILAELPNLQATQRAKEEERSKLEKGLDKRLTDEARKIKQTFWADRSEAFERPRLQRAIEDLGAAHADKLLSDSRYAEENAKFAARPMDSLAKAGIPKPCLDLPEIPANLLVTTPAGRAIERLQANPDLNLWAKRGWELHSHRADEQCAFCGNSLGSDRVQLLEQHFSAEYQKQLGDLLEIKGRYETARTLLDKAGAIQINRGNFYAHLTERATSSLSAFQGELKAERTRLSDAIAVLLEKEKNLFDQVSAKIPPPSDLLLASLDALNVTIAEHNEYGRNLAAAKEAARQVLTDHAVSQAATTTEYAEARPAIAALKTEAVRAGARFGTLDAERLAILAKIDQSTKGAEIINAYLATYFGKNDLRIAPNDKKRFEVRRGNKSATHLSEGEKTAISFGHFLATLEERGARIEEATVFIDDPVSSLDSNHLYGVFSLIENRLKDCKQLFISTHNHEFFDLLLDWRKNNNENIKDDSAGYLVRKLQDGEEVKCDLAPLPKELIKFRSEYVYLFSLVHRCEQNPIQGGELLTLPNAMRRFLEAFMRFKYVGLVERDRWAKCFGEAAERVRKYVNIGSHENAMRAGRIPDRQEAIEISKLVLAMLKRVDQDHFDGLISRLGS